MICLMMSVPVAKAPNEAGICHGRFRSAAIRSPSTAKQCPAHELIAELNKIGGKHGVGVRRNWPKTAWSA